MGGVVLVGWHHSAQSWPWRLGVGSVAASFQIRLGFFWVSEGDRPERGKKGGPDPFSPVGLGRSPSVSKDDGRCAGCVCIPLPPPARFIGGAHWKTPPPSPFYPLPRLPSLGGVGAAVRQRSAAGETTPWCAAHPLSPHLVFNHGIVGGLFVGWWGFCHSAGFVMCVCRWGQKLPLVYSCT